MQGTHPSVKNFAKGRTMTCAPGAQGPPSTEEDSQHTPVLREDARPRCVGVGWEKGRGRCLPNTSGNYSHPCPLPPVSSHIPC